MSITAHLWELHYLTWQSRHGCACDKNARERCASSSNQGTCLHAGTAMTRPVLLNVYEEPEKADVALKGLGRYDADEDQDR